MIRDVHPTLQRHILSNPNKLPIALSCVLKDDESEDQVPKRHAATLPSPIKIPVDFYSSQK